MRCGREDLNLHVLADTWPSTMPVCQFQHARALRRTGYQRPVGPTGP